MVTLSCVDLLLAVRKVLGSSRALGGLAPLLQLREYLKQKGVIYAFE